MAIKRRIRAVAPVLLFYVLIGSFSFCKQKGRERIETIIDNMLDKNTDGESEGLYKEIIKYKTQAIPYLIEKIDVRGHDYIGKLDPLNSNIMSLYNYNGVQAAYTTELILSGSNSNGERVLGRKSSTLCSRHIILKRLSHEALTYKDMIKIKLLYRNWWQRHQNERINILIDNWIRGDRPLSNSAYQWY